MNRKESDVNKTSEAIYSRTNNLTSYDCKENCMCNQGNRTLFDQMMFEKYNTQRVPDFLPGRVWEGFSEYNGTLVNGTSGACNRNYSRRNLPPLPWSIPYSPPDTPYSCPPCSRAP